MSGPPKTLFDQLWDAHLIGEDSSGVDLIAIDRLMLHERTGAAALKSLQARGMKAADPNRIFAIMDHVVSFRENRGRDEARSPGGEAFITETRQMAQEVGIHLIDTDDAQQGIVHVIGPELGIALPGLSLVCPDSHTCSLGALGALAWGVGSSDAEHVIATGVLRVRKPRQMRVEVTGRLQDGVSAKDIALALIGKYGTGGGQRMAIEFCGPVIDRLPLEGRLTLCNMAVEFAAFTAIIQPSEEILSEISGKPYAPSGADWSKALAQWRSLKSAPDAPYDVSLSLDVTDLEPMISWGTSPEDVVGVTASLPNEASSDTLDYMGLQSGQSLLGEPISGVFIGSCTNGRLSDLRAAASVLEGRRIAETVRGVCVPGSQAVKRAAEGEGLDEIFKAAGFEWGSPGCAMCFYAGGETFAPGARVVSSTNRNFRGRQGPGVRTHLASPLTAAACAVEGQIADPRRYLLKGKVAG